MARTWTTEEKQLASEKAKARIAAKASSVAVAEPEYEPEVMRPDGTLASDEGASHIAQTDVFIARMKALLNEKANGQIRFVARERMETISYGKLRPIEPGSSPEAWARNRNAITSVK